MLMRQHFSDCKRKARQLKSDYPDLSFTKRLDIAAKQQGFKHYTSLVNLLKLLGNDKSPTEIAIVMAGGNSSDCPYQTIQQVTRVTWSNTKNNWQ